MHTVKTATLTFLSISACLVLLLTPDSRRDEAPTGGAPPSAQQELPTISRAQTAMRLEREPFAAPARDDTPSPAGDKPESQVSSPAEFPTVDWTQILYPELARIEALENQPANSALIELIPMLSSNDPVIRLAAIESIGDIDDPNTAAALVAASGDPNPQLRIAAIEALASRQNTAVTASIEPYLYDPEQVVRLAAIDTISELADAGSVYALAGLLSDPDPRIRQRAVDALGEIGGENAMLYVEQARNDPSQSIRTDAELILSETARSRAN